MLGDSGLAQAFENALGPCQVRRVVAHRRPGDAGARNGKDRVELEAGLDCGTGLVHSTKLRKGDGQVKIRMRIISIGLDRPSKPRDSFLPGAEVVLRNARETLPGMGISIARTEAQGFANVGLCFFRTTDEGLTKSDKGVSAGQISIQLQRAFTFGDALHSALSQYFDIPQQPMAARVVRDRRQRSGQLGFGYCKGPHRIGHKEIRPLAHVRARRSNQRVDILGIGG